MGTWAESMPDVVSVTPLAGGLLRVAFEDGRSGAFDMAPWLGMPAFAPLADPELFRRARVEGGTVAWPGGADMAPDVLYDGLTADDATLGPEA